MAASRGRQGYAKKSPRGRQGYAKGSSTPRHPQNRLPTPKKSTRGGNFWSILERRTNYLNLVSIFNRFFKDLWSIWGLQINDFSRKIEINIAQRDFVKIELSPTREHDFRGSL